MTPQQTITKIVDAAVANNLEDAERVLEEYAVGFAEWLQFNYRPDVVVGWWVSEELKDCETKELYKLYT